MLEGVLFNFLTVLRFLPKSKSSLITCRPCFFMCFPFFVSSDIRSSQLISPRLTSSQLISCESRCVARKMRLKPYCANNNALMPLKFRKLITCSLQPWRCSASEFRKLILLPQSTHFLQGVPDSTHWFLGNNGIYHFTVLPFYGVPWEKTCLKPAPCTQTPQ